MFIVTVNMKQTWLDSWHAITAALLLEFLFNCSSVLVLTPVLAVYFKIKADFFLQFSSSNSSPSCLPTSGKEKDIWYHKY